MIYWVRTLLPLREPSMIYWVGPAYNVGHQIFISVMQAYAIPGKVWQIELGAAL